VRTSSISRPATHCTLSATIPDSGGCRAESLAISSMQCGQVNAELQWEMSRFLAESASVAA
jgi:hypothetical protein